MNKYVKQLKEYLATSSPEQLQRDYEELRVFNECGPTVEEYILMLDGLPEMQISNHSIANPDFHLDFFVYNQSEIYERRN